MFPIIFLVLRKIEEVLQPLARSVCTSLTDCTGERESSLDSRLEHRLSRNLKWKTLSAIEGKKKEVWRTHKYRVCVCVIGDSDLI